MWPLIRSGTHVRAPLLCDSLEVWRQSRGAGQVRSLTVTFLILGGLLKLGFAPKRNPKLPSSSASLRVRSYLDGAR